MKAVIGVKQCANCQQFLAYADFPRDAKRYPYCRDCSRAKGRESYARNKANESARKARAYAANRERFLARNRKWRAENRERERATNKAYYESHKTLFRLVGHAYRARLAGVPSLDFTVEQLAQRWAYFGNRCWICGGPANSSDHVKPVSKGGANMLCNIRPACRRCNGGKRDMWPFTAADATWLAEDVA